MRKLAQLRQGKLEQLGDGVDVEQYRYWLGYLRAFKDFAELLEEVKREDEHV
jgi:hypothetical protein